MGWGAGFLRGLRRGCLEDGSVGGGEVGCCDGFEFWITDGIVVLISNVGYNVSKRAVTG